MATKSRTMIVNQENVKPGKSVAAVQARERRPVLSEISNKVTALRGGEPIVDRINVLQKKKVVQAVPKRHVKPTEKALEKAGVPVVKSTAKIEAPSETASNAISENIQTYEKKETSKSFSTDLLKFEDIDEPDKKNPILVSIYTADIHKYLRMLEDQFPIRSGYLTGQDITPKMRSVLIDWLVEVHQQFRLMQETLYLTVATIDRFLQVYEGIDRKTLQLVGVTAMLIACKYEEMYTPDISDFVYITDQAYTKSDILHMEILIVKTLNYSFGRPLPLHFLRRYSKAGKALPMHHTMAKYFLEQSLVSYKMCHYRPSLIAAAAIYLAFLIIGNDEEDEGKVIWTNTLAHYSTYSKDDVLPAVQDIASIIVKANESKYQAVRKKYVHKKYMEISVRPELESPTMHAIAAKGET